MTRKRFVKLLMAQGYSRNDAREVAMSVIARKKSYADAYREIEEVSTFFLPSLADTLERTVAAFSRLANAFGVAANAFVDAFHAAMNKSE